MMAEIELFKAALNLSTPWVVTNFEFIEEKISGKSILNLFIGYEKGVRFLYEGEYYPVYDHQDRVWRHLDFFQHECYLITRVPRVKLKDGRVKLVDVPWAESGSSFTLLFEQKILEYIQSGMSALKCGQCVGIGSRRVFRICKRAVMNAMIEQDINPVKEMGLDETSFKKGHKYLTIITDRNEKKVVGIGFGKDMNALHESLLEMEIRGGDRSSVKNITMDMSVPFIAGVTEYMPKSEIIFDRFHLSYNLNQAIDKIRKREQREFGDLKQTKYLWLRNNQNLKKEHKQRIKELSIKYKDIGTAYKLKELFREVLDYAKFDSRLYWLNSWLKEAWGTGIKEIQSFVKMMHSHWYGIKTYFKKCATNAFAERINLKIQEIKRVAKGYRNLENYKTMIYLHLGGLKFGNPL
jgi:transposase